MFLFCCGSFSRVGLVRVTFDSFALRYVMLAIVGFFNLCFVFYVTSIFLVGLV
jgi:hypothetical protein